MGPQVYELRVRGTVPEEVLREIGALDVGVEPPLTILHTEPTDQSGLHGMLQRLRSLGLDLIEVRTEPVFDTEPTEPPGAATARAPVPREAGRRPSLEDAPPEARP